MLKTFLEEDEKYGIPERAQSSRFIVDEKHSRGKELGRSKMPQHTIHTSWGVLHTSSNVLSPTLDNASMSVKQRGQPHMI